MIENRDRRKREFERAARERERAAQFTARAREILASCEVQYRYTEELMRQARALRAARFK